mgnify:CR=1 FL=1
MKLQRVYVNLPRLSQYKQIVVLTHPGIVYVNLCAEEDALDVIFPDLAA